MKLSRSAVRSRIVNTTASGESATGFEFDETYRTHHRRILALCRYLLKSVYEAEDATQEVFLRAFRNRSTMDASKSPLNWLLKTATNHCLDRLRRRNREVNFYESADPDQVGPSKVSEDTLEIMVRAEKGDQVRSAIQSLPDRYRVPLVLAYYNEFTYDEIGHALNLNRNTVATLIYRARRRLREELTGLCRP